VGSIFRRPAWLSYLFTWQSTARHHQRENVDGGAPGGAGVEGPEAPTTNVKTSTASPWEVPELKDRERPHQRENVDDGPREVPELEIEEHSDRGACPSGRVVNGCRNLGTNAQRVVRIHFTLTQIGHFY
jgi:hypothetical protein